MGSSCESGLAAASLCCVGPTCACASPDGVVVIRTPHWAGDQVLQPRDGDGSSALMIRNSALAETPQSDPSQSLASAWDELHERAADLEIATAGTDGRGSLVVSVQRGGQGRHCAAAVFSQVTASPTWIERRAASPPRISRIPV